MAQPDPPSPRRDRSRRYSHRARHHDSAHADAEPAPAQGLPEHPLIPRGGASVVTDGEQLNELLHHLRDAKSFAYDSEFIGELTYHPRLCLIQVASAERIALIDPLAKLDLRPFWEILADPNVEKIVHAGMQDLEPVRRHIGRSCANVFDTQIAAGFCGMIYPTSLSKLVLELVGAKLGKGLTFTHWDQRPLSGMQLRYAADDVRYLPMLRHRLAERLEQRGHAAWAKQECDSLCDPSQYGFNPDTHYLRIRGASSLSPQGLAVLRELTIWRDKCARLHDVPPRTFLRDEVLADLARSPVKHVEKLARVRGLPRPVEAEHGVEIVNATNRALALPTSDMPQIAAGELSPTERFNADALWSAAQTIAAGRAIDPALVTNRNEISELARHLNENKPIDNHPIMTGWRREAVGQALIELVRAKRQITVTWSNGSLRTES